MLLERVIRKIEDIIGRGDLLRDEEDRVCYSYDANTTGSLPDLVVFPRTPEQVSRIMILANEYGFPVIPRGAGSGMTGGSVPVVGGVVVAMTKFNRILEIDPDELIAVVEPGVVNYDLQQEAQGLGLFFPPDPASYKYSTIGGNVAECAGGPRAVKYGVMKDYVLGLQVVLPTGEIIETGTRTMKGVVGYDLTRLFV
ncbi:MAG: glycolate oxidase subunit GlcD, partial [Deltaproteobacteria bacterium]